MKGPQKRLEEVEQKLGQLILYEAQRHYNKRLCALPQAQDAWEEAYVAAEAAIQRNDLMTATAEIAAYEDHVDEGNYNVVLASEKFWKRSRLTLADANWIFLSPPSLQDRVLSWLPQGDSQEPQRYWSGICSIWPRMPRISALICIPKGS